MTNSSNFESKLETETDNHSHSMKQLNNRRIQADTVDTLDRPDKLYLPKNTKRPMTSK